MLLQNLEISNFKAFKSVQLNDLGRVNLLVGKNNCGKTSVLEALRVFAGNGSLQSLLALAAEREDTGPQGFLKENEKLKALVAGLFKDYDFENNNQIVIGDTKQGKTVTIEYVTYASFNDHEHDRVWKKILSETELDDIYQKESGVEVWNGLDISDIHQKNNHIKFDNAQYILRKNIFEKSKKIIPIYFISSKNNDAGDFSSLMDEISLDDAKKQQVISALNLVEPKIKNLAFIEIESVSDVIGEIIGNKDTPSKKRMPFVRLQNSVLNIPLKSMGDGVHRILDIVLHLVSAEKGILLIDEFENGLHYAVQEKLWGLIFKIATELDVQVFVTTHSADCVHSFARASMETDENGVLYRIARPQQADEPHFVRRYSEEGLSDALDAEVEVR